MIRLLIVPLLVLVVLGASLANSTFSQESSIKRVQLDSLFVPRDGEVAVITWLLRPEDVHDCQTPASALRHVQRDLGSTVRLNVVMVGPHVASAGSFLRSERLDANLTHVEESTYREMLGPVDLPVLVVSDKNSKRHVIAEQSWSALAPDSGAALEQRIAQIAGT